MARYPLLKNLGGLIHLMPVLPTTTKSLRRLLMLEALQDRTLLSAGNLIALFEGALGSALDSQEIPISVLPADFGLHGAHTTLAFHLQAANGSAFDPAPVQIRN